MPKSKNGPESRDKRKSGNGIAGGKFAAYKSNLGAGYNHPGGPSGLSAFNVPKYGSVGLGGGIGGGIGGGLGGIGGGPFGGMGSDINNANDS